MPTGPARSAGARPRGRAAACAARPGSGRAARAARRDAAPSEPPTCRAPFVNLTCNTLARAFDPYPILRAPVEPSARSCPGDDQRRRRRCVPPARHAFRGRSAEEVPRDRADQAPQDEPASAGQETGLPHPDSRLACLVPGKYRPTLRHGSVVLGLTAVPELHVPERVEAGVDCILAPLTLGAIRAPSKPQGGGTVPPGLPRAH